MPRGRPSPKLAITVDPEVHAGVVAAAAAEGVSVSAWMTEAARRALAVRDGVAGVAERNDRSIWAEHRVRLEAGIVPRAPAPVVAQVSRSTRQVQLRRFLRGCDVAAFTEDDAHAAGRFLGPARTADVVDAAVVVLAVAHDAEIVTDDRRDTTRLLTAARSSLPVVDA